MKKKLIFLAGAVLLVAGVTAAVHAQRGGRLQSRGPAFFFEQLELTDAQQEQLKELHQELRAEMQSVRESGERPDPEAMRAIREAHFEKLESVLTEEQRARFEDLRAKFGAGGRGFPGGWWGHVRWGNRGGMWGHGPGAMRGHRGGWWGGPDRMQMAGVHRGGDAFAGLDLSDEQKAKLKELRGEHREEMEKLRDKHREEMEKLLTKEQRKELEELKNEAFYGGRGMGMRGWKRGPRR